MVCLLSKIDLQIFSGGCVGKFMFNCRILPGDYLFFLLFKLTCFLHYSEVKIFDPSGDSTLPAVSKKRKIQEVEEQDAEVAVKAKKFKAEMKG